MCLYVFYEKLMDIYFIIECFIWRYDQVDVSWVVFECFLGN